MKFMSFFGSPDKSLGQLSLAWKAIHIGLPMLVTGGNALGKEGQADNSLEGFTSTFTTTYLWLPTQIADNSGV